MVPLGTITVSSTVPDGFGEPVTMCTHIEYSPVLDYPPPDEIHWSIGASLTVDVALGDSLLCEFFHVAETPQSNSTWLGVWHCPDGTASGQALNTYLAACTEGLEGLDVTLGMWNGVGGVYGTTVDGVVQFPSTNLGHIFLEPELPAGIETLAVYCGIAQSPGGEIESPALQVLTPNGMARGFLEGPGTEFACHWFAASVEIDDLQANPPEEPEADDVTANPSQRPSTVSGSR